MKRIIILILATLVAISMILASCAAPATTEVETAAPAVEEEMEPSQPEAEEKEEPSELEAEAEIVVPSREEGYAGPPLTTEPIELRVLRASNMPEREELWLSLLDEFTTAHPNITINSV